MINHNNDKNNVNNNDNHDQKMVSLDDKDNENIEIYDTTNPQNEGWEDAVDPLKTVLLFAYLFICTK